MPQRAWSAKPDESHDQPENAGQSAPARVYAFGRFGRWVGRLLGGEGRRTGARDTDPGH